MNELIVTKNVLQADKHAIIDWVYGNDEKSTGGSTVMDFSAVPFAERGNVEVVKAKLIEQLGVSFFEDVLNSQTNSPA